MKKRILALVLSVAMVLSFIPFSVFADGEATNPNEIVLFDAPATLEEAEGSKSAALEKKVVTENGENFVVYGDGGFGEYHGYNATLNLNPVVAEEDLSDVSTRYVAIRIKIDDKTPAFEYQNSMLETWLLNDNAEGGGAALGKSGTYFWLDYTDGSMIEFRAADVSGEGVSFNGDMDGWLILPVSANSKCTADFFQDGLKSIQFYFRENEQGTSKESNWANKEFMVGDVLLVKDHKTFATERCAQYSATTKYAPNGAADTAYYGVKISGNEPYQCTWHKEFGKTKNDPTVRFTHSGTTRTYMHVVALPNGDRALEISVPDKTSSSTTANETNTSAYAGLTAGNYYYSSLSYGNTYEGTRDLTKYYHSNSGGSKVDKTALDNSEYLAFRIATTGVNAAVAANNGDSGCYIIIRILLRVVESSSQYYNRQAFNISNVGTFKYIDVNTGETEDVTFNGNFGGQNSKGFKPTKDLDGYILIPRSAFTNGTLGTMDKDEYTYTLSGNSYTHTFGEMWGGDFNTDAGNDAVNYMIHGTHWNKSVKLYAGDVLFVQNQDTFLAYHSDCAKSGHVYVKTAEEAATCTEAGSITYTCQRTACTDKTLVEPIPALGHAWVEAAGEEASCTEPGFVESYCDRECGVEPKVETIPATGHTEAETATPAGDDANHNYLCTVCGEIAKSEPCDYVEDETKRVEPQVGVAGKKVFVCSVCGDEKEEEIPAIEAPTCEHTEYTLVGATEAKCGVAGYTGDKKCNACGEIFEEGTTIEALVHDTDVVLEGKDATCTETGLTAGAKCSKCGEVQVPQEEIPALDHNMVAGEPVAPTEFESGYTLYTCANNCGTTEKKDFVMPLSSAVQNIKAEQVTGTMDMTFSWDAIDGADRYLVYVFDATGAQVRGVTIKDGKTTTRINGFKVGTYTVKVTARVGGKYTKNNTAVEVAMGSILPAAPDVTVVETGKDSITVKWDAVEGAVKYFVEVVGGDQRFAPGTTGTELTITGLKVNTEYKISINVKFGTAVYTGYVEKASAKTDAHADIEITADKTEDGIVVAWDVTNDNDTANKYWVKRVDAEGNVTQIAVTTDTSIVAKDVEGANTFYIIARVKDKHGIYRYVTSAQVTAE